MTNDQIADTLTQLADLLEFKGTNPFRLRAYRNAAKSIEEMSDSIESLVKDDFDLTSIDGIGKAVAEKCKQLVETGRLRQLDELLEEIPKSVLDLLRIPKLGPKKAAVIFNDLGIATLAELKAACEKGKLRDLPGFAAKTEQAILEGIEIASAANQRVRWADADKLVAKLRNHFKSCKAIRQLEFAGSYRRGKETVGDLDILVDSDDSETVMDRFGEYPGIKGDISRGPTKMSVRLEDGFQIDLRVVPAKSFGAALQYFTGSKEHNVVVRSKAKQKKMKVNEWGIFKVKGDKETYFAGKTEEELYKALGLPWFPPEMRECRGEFDQAETGELTKLIELKQIRGDLHMHTTESDGSTSVEEMADAAQQRGLKYIAITDHSKRVAMANGLDEKRLLKQWKAIDKLNQSFGDDFQVFKGVEVDILENGDLDIEDAVLAQADWVTASIHYGQNQPRKQITERIVGAIENPTVHAISHPTGRLINKRNPYEVDMEAVFKAAKKHKKMLELNASPQRLDLHDIHCLKAREMGILIVINTDAHRPSGMDDMQYGIKQARRGGLTAKDVANTRTLKQFRKLIGAS